MSDLHDAFDQIVADVPVYGDLDRAIEQAATEQRRRYGVIGALAAAAAAAGIIVVLSITGDAQKAQDPIETPKPTEVIPLATDGSIYFAAESSAGDALTDPRSFGEVETDPLQMDIYISRQGQPVRRIVATNAHERCPSVSPDGEHLAYLAGGTIVIVPLDADGNPGAAKARVDLKARNLFLLPEGYQPRNSGGPACPQWSPDGRRLGYLAVLGGDGFVESIYDPVATEVHAVTPDGEDKVLAAFDSLAWDQPTFAWSPSGKEIAYTTVDGVWRDRQDGSAPELLWRSAEGDPTQMQPMDYDRPVSLTWSSQDELAFTVRAFNPTEPNNPMSGGFESWTVVVIDAGSGRVRLEEEAGSVLERGAGEGWSPDGSHLVFTGADGRIRIHDRATGATTRLQLSGPGLDDARAPVWSPDGRVLLARAGNDDGIALVSFALDGSSSEVRTPWTWAFDWSTLDDVDWSGR